MKRTLPIERKPNEKEPSKHPERDAPPPSLPSAVVDRRPSKVQKTGNQELDHDMKALRERMRRDVAAYKDDIVSSNIYMDDTYQYRHVKLPKQIANYLPPSKEKILLKEHEYRRLGINISSGWEHYLTYQPEPNILLLRRTHELSNKLKKEAQEEEIAKEQRKKEQAKASAAPRPSDKGASESSTAATSSASKGTRTRRKATTTTMAADDQQKTKNQA